MKNGNFILRYQVGLIIALALVLISFEWQQFSESVIFRPDFTDDRIYIEDEIIPITVRPIPAPPEPVKNTTKQKISTIVTEPTIETKKAEPFEPVLIDVPFFEPEIIEETPLYTAEIPPEFPGGLDAMYKYLYDEIDYSARCRDAGVEGTVHARFVVGKSGNVQSVEILRGIEFCKELEKEVEKAISKMPKWQAGKQNGRKVSVYYTVPVRFTLRN